MKVTDLKMIQCSHYLFIRIETDNGLCGIGEAGAWGYLDACRGALEKFREYLLGKDPFTIEHHWNYMYRGLYFRGAVIMSAISAVDIALWDLKGKYLGVPVYELLGGRCRDRVRCYAPVKEYSAKDAANRCVELKKMGFTAARVMMNDCAENPLDPPTYSGKVNRYVEKVKACREAAGPDFDLVLEVHRSMSAAEAVALGRAVESCTPLFMEDPIPPDCMARMEDVISEMHVPVATGERFISLQEFEELLNRTRVKYIRPDVCTIGGITASKKIAAIAEAHYVGLVPHNPLGPVSTAACLQLDACVSNLLIQEYPSFNVDGKEDGMLKECITFEDGYIKIPDGPGLGIELIDGIEAVYPPKQRDYTVKIGHDGSVCDR